jgi:hypothetical protein
VSHSESNFNLKSVNSEPEAAQAPRNRRRTPLGPLETPSLPNGHTVVRVTRVFGPWESHGPGPTDPSEPESARREWHTARDYATPSRVTVMRHLVILRWLRIFKLMNSQVTDS